MANLELQGEPGQDNHSLGMLRRNLSEPASAKVPPKYLFLLFVDRSQRKAGVPGRAHALGGLSKHVGLEPVRASIAIHPNQPCLGELAQMTANPLWAIPERRSKLASSGWTHCERTRDGEAFRVGQNRK